jgi:hypothetical protein
MVQINSHLHIRSLLLDPLFLFPEKFFEGEKVSALA